MRRYGSEDNHRWQGFEHRAGDIVVSTRSTCGTTWVQMICALLVFGTPDLPAPLAAISPWLDWDVEPVDTVRAGLAAQRHRRIIKTHTRSTARRPSRMRAGPATSAGWSSWPPPPSVPGCTSRRRRGIVRCGSRPGPARSAAGRPSGGRTWH